MTSEERKAAEMTIVTMRREGCETVAQDIDAAMCKLFPSYPAPAAEPLPCCPTCGTEGLCKDSRYHYCSACNANWREDRRVPCPSCADLRERVTGLLAELSQAHGKETMETVKRLRAQEVVQGNPCPKCATQQHAGLLRDSAVAQLDAMEARAEAAETALRREEASRSEWAGKAANANARAEAAEAKVAELRARMDASLAYLKSIPSPRLLDVAMAIHKLEGKDHA